MARHINANPLLIFRRAATTQQAAYLDTAALAVGIATWRSP